MHAVKGSRDAFLLKEWLAADADARTAADASLHRQASHATILAA